MRAAVKEHRSVRDTKPSIRWPARRSALQLSREDQNIRTGDLFHVGDWWERISPGPWMTAAHDRAAAKYTVRSEAAGLPTDGEIVYGQIGGVGYLVHVSELGPALPTYAVG